MRVLFLIIIDRNRTMIFDSKFGFLDLKALGLKDKLESDEINELINYMKSLMNNAIDRNTIKTDNYQFFFNKRLISRGIKIQNDVLTKKVKANGLRLVLSVCGIMGTCFMMYNYISPDTAVKTAALVAGSK